jgi:hypothetical protein
VSAWTPEHWDLVSAARRELNERRLHAMSELTTRRLFADLLRESQAVFAEVGIQLALGEALFVAKMLTYTTTYFMITEVGYPHVLELAIALAFALVEETLGREPWQVAEQRALRDLILQYQSSGTTLQVEFLYVPLILGGLVVAHELVLEGENVQQSLDLLVAAKTKRAEWFADPELAEINDVFEELLTKQMSS